MTIVYTGGVQGALEPCGCSPGQLGGVARLATLVAQIRKENPDTIFVDAGDLLLQDPEAAGSTFEAAPSDYAVVSSFRLSSPPNVDLAGTLCTINVAVRKITDVTDGTSNTFLMFENADKTAQWRAGVMVAGPADQIYNNSNNGTWGNGGSNNSLRGWDATGTIQFGEYCVNKNNGAGVYAFHPGGAYVVTTLQPAK